MTIDDLDLDEKKPRNRGLIVTLAVVALAAAGGGLYLRHHMQVTSQHDAMKTASDAWASLQRCLIGGALAPNEDLTLRIHRVEVNRDPVPRGMSPSDMNDRWPYRCAVFATALRDGAGAMEPQGTGQRHLREAAEHARTLLTRGQTETSHLGSHEATVFDALWAAASEAQLGAGTASGPAAPAPSPMLVRTDFHALFTDPGGGEPVILATDRSPGASLHVAASQGHLFGCGFAAPMATAQCTPLGVPVAGAQTDVTLFDTDDAVHAFPPVRVGVGATAHIAGLPGSTVPAGELRPFAFRGSVAAAGDVTVVDSGNEPDLDAAAASGHWRLSRTHADGSAGFRGPLALPPASSRPDLLTDQVLYLASSEPGHGPPRVGLFSRALLPNAGALGAVTDVGTVLEDTRIAGHCRMGSDLAVALTAPGKVMVALSYGGHWQAIATFDGRFTTMNCSATGVTVTWVDGRPPSIHQLACTAAHCATTVGNAASLATALAPTAGTPQIADLGDSVLVVWTPGEGGLRMRLAPLAQLNDAHDTVLYDDHAHLGGWVLSPTLYARGGSAVVMFIDSEHENDKQPYAIHVAHDGTFGAVAPTH